nr:uncharacterized protein LOC123756772 isoform X1 [Procambarus clarkii]
MERACGRGGVRSGRAVVGLDTHTLPGNFRTRARPPCCQPATRPLPDDLECAGCRPDLCQGGPYACQGPQGPWCEAGAWRECATCRLLATPPCACRDPCCLQATPTSPLTCTWVEQAREAAPQQQVGAHAAYQDLQVTPTASVCELPKLRSVEDRLTTALGHPLDTRGESFLETHPLDTHGESFHETHPRGGSYHQIHPYGESYHNTHSTSKFLAQSGEFSIHQVQESGQAVPSRTRVQGQSRAQVHTDRTNAHGKRPPYLPAHSDAHTDAHTHHNASSHRGRHCHHLEEELTKGCRGIRRSRSVESLPREIEDHLLKCQCSCDHLGHGNSSAPSLPSLPGLTNSCSSASSRSSSTASRDSKDLTEIRNKQQTGGGVEVPAHVWGGLCLVLVLAGVGGVGVTVPLALRVDPNAGLADRLNVATTFLKDSPLVDGHNDLPWNIRKFMHNKLHSFNFTAELKKLRPWSRSSWSHTDLPRLKEGMVGAQFWVSYVPCESQRLNAVQLTIEQIDLIKRLIDQYPDDLRLATSADEVEAAFKEGRIASLIGVEGGHAIQNSLGVLRALRDLGVRYLTLTHTCSTPWAECARARETDLEDPDSPRGLTHFGRTVVREMNRLGLLVDLSHVSQATMKEALEVSRAPVIFSHSSVYAICKNPRNVPDDILRKVAVNGGLVMVSFYNHFLTCSQHASVKDVVAHINHVRKVAGVDHVGIGADFDGVNQ